MTCLKRLKASTRGLILWCSLFGSSAQAWDDSMDLGAYASIASSTSEVMSRSEYSKSPVIPRTTYGLKVDLPLYKAFALGLNVGLNQVETTKSAAAMSDEFDEINFDRKLGVDRSAGGSYHYKESQRVSSAQLLTRFYFSKASAAVVFGLGARARERQIEIEKSSGGTAHEYKDIVRVHPLILLGFHDTIFKTFRLGFEYRHHIIDLSKIGTEAVKKSSSSKTSTSATNSSPSESSDDDSSKPKEWGNSKPTITVGDKNVVWGPGEQEFLISFGFVL
jgi:hypothetical protein